MNTKNLRSQGNKYANSRTWKWNRLKKINAPKKILEHTTDLAVHSSGNIIATSNSGGEIKVWEFENAANDSFYTLKGHLGKITKIIFSDVNLISCGQDKTIRFWCLKSKKEVFKVDKKAPAEYMDLSQCGKFICIANTDKVIKRWNIETKSQLI